MCVVSRPPVAAIVAAPVATPYAPQVTPVPTWSTTCAAGQIRNAVLNQCQV